jgi:hypothetical protein
MMLGKLVTLYTYDRTVATGQIIEYPVIDKYTRLPCYKVKFNEFEYPVLFILKPELNTGRHYNVSNKAYWIIK